MKKRLFLIAALVYVLTGAGFPSAAQAAALSVQSDSAFAAGDTAVLDVYLDTQGETVNAIEGSLIFAGPAPRTLRFADLSVGGSAFTLWPRKPSLAADGSTVVFVGGAPSGVSGARIKLFSVSVQSSAPGMITVGPVRATAYRADGTGAAIPVAESRVSVVVGQKRAAPRDFLAERLSKDTTPPDTFDVVYSTDPSVAEGRAFLSFAAQDSESGIAYYTVREKGYPDVRSGETYVIINQDAKVKAVVTAYDRAGNARSVTYRQQGLQSWFWAVGTILAVGIVAAWILRRRTASVRPRMQ